MMKKKNKKLQRSQHLLQLLLLQKKNKMLLSQLRLKPNQYQHQNLKLQKML